MSLRRIADQLNCSMADAEASFIRMCNGVPPALRARIMALERLDEMQAGIYKYAIPDPNDPTKKPDLNAIHTMLKIQERRDKLLGLDTPPRDPALDDPNRPAIETSTERVRAAINRIRGKGNTVIDAVAVPIDNAPDKPEE
jgi:hypothetical protein